MYEYLIHLNEGYTLTIKAADMDRAWQHANKLVKGEYYPAKVTKISLKNASK